MEDHLQLTRRLQRQRLTPRLLRNLLITELILSAGLNAAEISRLNVGDVLWRGGLPGALVVWRGRKPRLILIRDKFLRQLIGIVPGYQKAAGRFTADKRPVGRRTGILRLKHWPHV